MNKTACLSIAAVLTALPVSGSLAAQPKEAGGWAGQSLSGIPLSFKVGAKKKKLSQFDFGTHQIQCDTFPDGELNPYELEFSGQLRIGPRGGFRGVLPGPDVNEGAIVIRGRFVNPGKAVGSVRYQDRGCIGQNVIRWKATKAFEGNDG